MLCTSCAQLPVSNTITLMTSKPKLILWDWQGTLYYDQPLQYSHQLIELFSKNDILQGVVSNAMSRDIQSPWKFDIIVGADAGLPLKPNPAMILYALKALKVDPKDTLFIGDSTTDMQAASAAGCKGYCVARGLKEVWEFYSIALS